MCAACLLCHLRHPQPITPALAGTLGRRPKSPLRPFPARRRSGLTLDAPAGAAARPPVYVFETADSARRLHKVQARPRLLISSTTPPPTFCPLSIGKYNVFRRRTRPPPPAAPFCPTIPPICPHLCRGALVHLNGEARARTIHSGRGVGPAIHGCQFKSPCQTWAPSPPPEKRPRHRQAPTGK